MKPPVEEVRISVRGKETLAKLKRRTGLTQWNHLCRIAYCRSLANPVPPGAPTPSEAGIRMDWKTFSGPFAEELVCLNTFRARRDGIDVTQKDQIGEYFRAHLERGIASLDNITEISDLVSFNVGAKS